MRFLATLLLAAVCGSAAAQQPHNDPRFPQTQEEKQFYSLVARSVFQVMPGEQGRFGLGLGDREHPAFAGQAENSLEQVQCERLAAFVMIGYATELGHIGAAACANGAKVRELALRSGARITELRKAMLPGKPDAADKLGWYYARETLKDGSEFHYFPVILVGHGVLGVTSAVIYEKKTGRATVVQAETRQMCGEHFVQEFKDVPFCTDMRAALKRIVQAVHAGT